MLRCSDGYTKRANSVTPLYESALAPDGKIAACERFYASQGLPCVFRLPSFAPPELDALLERRGYRALDRTLVLSRSLAAPLAEPVSAAEPVPLDAWLESYSALAGAGPAQRAGHRAILERIAGQPAYLLLCEGGAPVACGLGVLEDDHVGLFDLVVAPERRGAGIGGRLVGALLGWAVERGASAAYLQVVAENAPARRLYQRWGFGERYQYWYRQAP
ncbi:MAG TPA: GNAT family N-acetyltransferase [Herpetosiphonaceae bacterium]